MGLFDIFGKKPDKRDITAYNYYLNFDYLPKKLHEWENNRISFQSVLDFDPLINKNLIWKSLVKKTEVTSTGVNKFPDLTLYLIKTPSTEVMAEVAMSMIAINHKLRKALYYTMEYSLGDFMICSADIEGNHFNIDSCKNGEQFGAYVLKEAMDKLTTKTAPQSTKQPSSSTAAKATQNSNSGSIPNIIGKYYSLSQLRQVSMGVVRLQPIDGKLAIDPSSQMAVEMMAKLSPDIKRFLPNLNLSSISAIGNYFSLYCTKTELGYEFGYSIKTGEDGYLGFIFVHTPAMNEKSINFPHWTVDFCLFEPFRGNGIMTQALARVLYILKSEMNVKNLYVYVDEDNTNCLNMLSNLPFDLQPQILKDPNTGNKAKLFRCPLHEINFQS